MKFSKVYKLGTIIGRGSFSKVYEVTEVGDTSKRWAVKMVPVLVGKVDPAVELRQSVSRMSKRLEELALSQQTPDYTSSWGPASLGAKGYFLKFLDYFCGDCTGIFSKTDVITGKKQKGEINKKAGSRGPPPPQKKS